MNRIILGRITEPTKEILDKKVEMAIVDNYNGQHYFDTRNPSLESFLVGMKSVQNICGSAYWRIPCLGSFIEEAESRMPKILPDMDDLDQYYAEQVLDFLPHTLLYLKQDLQKDTTTGRFSEYYVRTVGVVTSQDLGVIIVSSYSTAGRAFIRSSPFIEQTTGVVTNPEQFVADARTRLEKFHTGDVSLESEINPILTSILSSENKNRQIRFSNL